MARSGTGAWFWDFLGRRLGSLARCRQYPPGRAAVRRLFLERLEERLAPAGGAIQGTIWQDLNNNGIQDTGELGLANRVVYIDTDGNGRFDSGEPSLVTD